MLKHLSMAAKAARGFSLVELAVVLMIVGTLMGGVLVAVGQSMENSRRSAALAQLRQLEEALYGYAQATGRLPCPATAASGGREDPAGGGDCTAWHGFVPVTTLGFSGSVNADGLLLDPWRNPYRYSVANKSMAGNRAFTSTTGMQSLYDNAAAELQTWDGSTLRVCDTVACDGNVLSDTVPALLLSMGPDWGSFTSAEEEANASGATLAGASTSYPVTDTPDFVVTGYAEDLFDDQLVWLSPYILFNRLISAGKLP